MKINRTILMIPMIATTLAFSSCNKSTPKVTEAKLLMHVYNEDETNNFPYVFNLDEYTVVDGNANENIAKMGILFSANISHSTSVFFKGSKIKPQSYVDYESFYKYLNLDNFETANVGEKAEADTNDQTFLNFAHKKIQKDGADYDICFLTIEDSGGKAVYWSSNFDLGADDENYYSLTGQHDEWTNKNNHKGFDVSANRCLPVVEDYISRNLDKNSQQILYVFGHSRGGALCNVVSAKLIDKGYKTVGYGYASPATTTDKDATSAKYQNIHNYYCEDDIISGILPPQLGFVRYGQSESFKIQDYKEQFKDVNNVELPNADISILTKLFAKLADSREEVYSINDKYTVTESEPMDESEVDAYVSKYTSAFTGYYKSLKGFIKVEKIPSDGNLVKVKITTCAGFYLNLIGSCIAKNDVVFGKIALDLFKFSNYLQILFDATGYSFSDLATMDFAMVVYAHYYYSYLAYFHK